MATDNVTAPSIKITDLTLRFGSGSPLFDNLSLDIGAGETTCILGPSGCGKSTLLGLIAGVVVPQQGTVKVNGCPLNELHGAARDRFRADNIGFIYQMFNLIPYLSVVENVTLPCKFSQSRQKRALLQATSLEEEALRLLGHLRRRAVLHP